MYRILYCTISIPNLQNTFTFYALPCKIDLLSSRLVIVCLPVCVMFSGHGAEQSPFSILKISESIEWVILLMNRRAVC